MIQRRKFLEIDEAERFLSLARTTYNRVEPLAGRDYVLLSLALNSGAREGELASLNLEDVVTYRVRKRISSSEERIALDIFHAKRGKSRRVPLPPEMADTLVAYVERRRAQGARDLDPLFEGRRAFAPAEGRYRKSRIARRTLRELFGRIRDAAGLRRDLSFHSLRHTFAVHHYRANRDLVGLKELLGHESLRTTQVYVSTTPEELAESVDRLPAALSPRLRRDRTVPPAPPSPSPSRRSLEAS